MNQPEISRNESEIPIKPALPALLFSLSSSLFCCASIALFLGFTENFHYGPAGALALCFSCLGVLSPLIGIVMGGMALARGASQNLVAVIAIAAGALFMIAAGIVLAATFMFCCTAM